MSDLKSKTARGLLWGGMSSLLQQLIGLFFGIIIARILTPADYGMVGMLAIFGALAVVLQESGFVFVLTNRPGTSDIEYSTVFWFNISVSLLLYLLLFFCAPLIADFFGKEELVSLSRFIFLGFVFSSFGVVQNAYLYKKMKVKERAIARLTALFIACIIGYLMAINGFQYWGIATQGLVSTFISTIIIWFYSPFRPKFIFDRKFLLEILPDGIRFAISNIVAVFAQNIYSIILGRFYTVKDVGYYSQAGKFNTYGYSFILSMVRNVSQPMLVQLRDNPLESLSAFRKLIRFTAFVSFPTMIGISLVAPELISLLLTNKWLNSAYILRILCIGGAFTSLATLFSYLFVSMNQSSLYMWLAVFVAFLQICFAIVASFGGIYSLAIACASLELFGFLLYFHYSRKMISYNFRMVMEDIGGVIMAVIISAGLAIASTWRLESQIGVLILKIISFLITFSIVMKIIKFDIFEEIKYIIINKSKTIWKNI